RRTVGRVHAVCGRLVTKPEALPRIGLRVERLLYLCRHVGGEAFLQPQVVEPAHGHEVAEPHVRDLVVNGRGAADSLRQRGTLAEYEALLAVEHGTRMLHAAERECR